MIVKNGELLEVDIKDLKLLKENPNLFWKGIHTIGRRAFPICKELTELEIPSTVKKIDAFAFSENDYITSVILPDTDINLGSAVFLACPNLENVHLPNNLTVIPRSTFGNCFKLKNIQIPKSVKKIDYYAFTMCKSLEKIDLPETLEHIEKSAFSESALTEFIMPKNVTYLGVDTFSNCTKLKKVVLNNLIKEIPSNCFEQCYKLEHIKIPDNIEIIKFQAFMLCQNLKSIILPANLRYVDSCAFNSCIKLKLIGIKNPQTHYSENFLSSHDGQSDLNDSAYIYYYKKKLLVSRTPIEKDNVIFLGDMSYINKYFTEKVKLADILNDISLLSNLNNLIPILEKQKIVLPSSFIKNLHTQNLLDNFNKNAIFRYYNKLYDIATKFPDFVNPKSSGYNAGFFADFCYAFGLFEKPITRTRLTRTGNKITETVDYASKMYVLLSRFVSTANSVALETFYWGLRGLVLKKFNPDFADFVLQKDVFEQLLDNSLKDNFIAKIYNSFEEVQKHHHSSKGRQRTLAPTIEKFIFWFEKNKFFGVTEENENIACEIAKYFDQQKLFDDAVKLMQQQKHNKVRKSFLKNNFDSAYINKNEEMFGDILSYDKYLPNNKIHRNDKITFELLPKDSPINLTLGQYTSCCAHINGVGYSIMKASILDENVQNFIFKRNGAIIAKSTLYINPQNGYGVFNNISISYEHFKDEWREEIYKEFKKAVECFVRQYNIENPNRPLKIMNIGTEINDLDEFIEKNDTPAKEILIPCNYSTYDRREIGEGYEGDCSTHQATLVLPNAYKALPKEKEYCK